MIAMAKIIPRNARWAKVLPPILGIFLFATRKESMEMVIIGREIVAIEIPFVVLKGDISTERGEEGFVGV